MNMNQLSVPVYFANSRGITKNWVKKKRNVKEKVLIQISLAHIKPKLTLRHATENTTWNCSEVWQSYKLVL